MDSREIQTVLKALEKTTTPSETLNLLNKLKNEVKATEELLRSTKVGHFVNRKKAHPDPQVSKLASEIVHKWRGDVGKAKKPSAASPKNGGGSASPSNPEPQITVPLPERSWRKDKVDISRTPDEKRNKAVGLIYDGLAPHSPELPLFVVKHATDIERACATKYGAGTPKYQSKLRSLYQNLRAKSNPQLRRRVLKSEFTADKFVVMTDEELASAERRAEDESLKKQNMDEAMVAKAEQSVSKSLVCGKCKAKNVSYTQAQTRSADEPMTTFCHCQSCGNRWKFC
ncbi:MAG: RNA polymerase II elongation factor [Vezdaea aestivalis]|nr:MAG: RNA polymerase II elongation factor [Vezdaea aestivalis]